MDPDGVDPDPEATLENPGPIPIVKINRIQIRPLKKQPGERIWTFVPDPDSNHPDKLHPTYKPDTRSFYTWKPASIHQVYILVLFRPTGYPWPDILYPDRCLESGNRFDMRPDTRYPLSGRPYPIRYPI